MVHYVQLVGGEISNPDKKSFSTGKRTQEQVQPHKPPGSGQSKTFISIQRSGTGKKGHRGEGNMIGRKHHGEGNRKSGPVPGEEYH